jgi:hypothetical protein
VTNKERYDLVFDPRFVASFYKHPELFQRLRNKNYAFHMSSNPTVARKAFMDDWTALIDVLPESLHPSLQALEFLWDTIDVTEKESRK